MTEILPNILTDDINELKALLSEAAAVGERVQIDIIDGEFADNVTVDPSVLTTLTTSLKLDYHLMVVSPRDWVAKCANAFGDRVLGQIEKMEDQIEFVKEVGKWKMKPGLVVDINTGVESIEGAVYPELAAVQVMSVPAGFGGQKFNEKALNKIKKLDILRVEGGHTFSIIADGGITPEKVEALVLAGADEIGIGNRLFAGDSRKNINKYKSAIRLAGIKK